jgi:DNA-binding MarR family transcriptional regulator
LEAGNDFPCVAEILEPREEGAGSPRDCYALTPAGTNTLAAGHLIANDVFRASFANLSEEERSTLLELLLRITGESLT